MQSLVRGQASDCVNPALVLYTRMNSTLIDVAALSFQIFDKVSASTPTQVYPVSGRQAVDLSPCPTGDMLGVGHYVARWNVPTSEALGKHEIRWFFKLTPTSQEQSYAEDFDVLPIVVPVGGSNEYATVQQLRDEGVTPAMATDSQLLARIELCSALIEQWTGRWFYPKAMTLTLDGSGSQILQLGPPIISVSSLRFLYQDVLYEHDYIDYEMLDAEVRVYNRHLTQQLLDPDDRNNPKLRYLSEYGYFPRGTQNIEVTGVFGYTDPDGTPVGRTPRLINQVCMMLVVRELAKLGNVEARDEALMRGRITSIRTRDQSITWNATKAGVGWTGDSTIDTVIARYCRPPSLGAA